MGEISTPVHISDRLKTTIFNQIMEPGILLGAITIALYLITTALRNMSKLPRRIVGAS